MQTSNGAARSGVPWRGLAMVVALLLFGYATFVDRASGATPDTVPMLTDQYGRVDWARLGAMSAVAAGVIGAVLWVLAPHFRARARALRMESRAEWAEDVFAAFEFDPMRGKAVIVAMFPSETEQREEAHRVATRTEATVIAMSTALTEAKILQAVPRIEENVSQLTEAMTELTRELRTLREDRAKERISDREEFGRLSEQVRQIHSFTYDGPDRRLRERRTAAGDDA